MPTISIDKDRIKELLGQGLSVGVVASALGCDQSYVSTLMSNQAFAEDVAELRSVALTAHTKRDRKLDGIEDRLLDKMNELVDQQQFYKPRDVLHALDRVNNMKRRGVAAAESTIVANTVVNLQLPSVVVNKFTVNVQGEVTGVGDQTLVTMPAAQLLKQLSTSKTEKDSDKYQKVANFLPREAEVIDSDEFRS